MNSIKIPPLLSKADLATRWGVSRQVVNNWESRHDDFPPVAIAVHNGSLPLYLESDVEVYERSRNLQPKQNRLSDSK